MRFHRSLFRSLLPAAALLALVACSDDTPERVPTSPRPTVQHSTTDAASIRDQIRALFAGKDEAAALDKFKTVETKYHQGKVLDAQLKVADLVSFLLSKEAAGKLTDPNNSSPPTIDQAVATLIASLYAFVGQENVTIGPGALGNDGKIQVVTTDGSTNTTVVTDTKLVGVRFAGSRVLPQYPTTFTLVFERLSNDFILNVPEGAVAYGRYYKITTLPHVEFDPAFTLPVLGMCPFEIGAPGGVPSEADYDDLLLARNVGEGIESFPNAGAVAFVDCNTGPDPDNGFGALDRGDATWSRVARLAKRAVSFFAPKPLYAGHGGKSATLSSLSDWGFVDPDGTDGEEINSGFGTATTTTQFVPSEWTNATQVSFQVDRPSLGPTPATLYIMNDASNLYLAVRFARDEPFDTESNSLLLTFDNDADGAQELGDDRLRVAAGFFSEGATFSDNFLQCGIADCAEVPDSEAEGTVDGSGDFRYEPPLEIGPTISAYQVSHPLNSGDSGHDFALSSTATVPSVVGLRLTMQIQAYTDGTATTSHPTEGDLRIRLAAPPPPILFAVPQGK